MIRRFLEHCKLSFIYRTDDKANTKLRSYYKKRYNVNIGKYTYGYCIEDIGSNSSIGSFCSIASGVKIGKMNHPIQYVSTNPFLYYKSRGFIADDINITIKTGAEIGDDVWIGNNAVILPGISVGRGAIIGAGAVVTKDVQAYAIMGGYQRD